MHKHSTCALRKKLPRCVEPQRINLLHHTTSASICTTDLGLLSDLPASRVHYDDCARGTVFRVHMQISFLPMCGNAVSRAARSAKAAEAGTPRGEGSSSLKGGGVVARFEASRCVEAGAAGCVGVLLYTIPRNHSTPPPPPSHTPTHPRECNAPSRCGEFRVRVSWPLSTRENGAEPICVHVSWSSLGMVSLRLESAVMDETLTCVEATRVGFKRFPEN